MKKTSLKDIAKLAGVAPSTVSLVLNGKAKQMRISEKLAHTIIKVAKKAGYQPNQLAVSLRTGKSKILGLIVESISGHLFGALAKIIEDAVEKFDYKVVYCSTENDSQKGHELIRMLSQRQVDGYIITPAQGMEKDIVDLVNHRMPVVLMDGYLPKINVPYVTVDNYGGVQKGLSLLVNKGHRQIGYVTVDLPLTQIKDRGRAYADTLKANGIRVQKKLVLELDYNQDKDTILAHITSFIQANAQMKAVFFATNYLGIAGLESIKQLGLSIPRDIAIVCFDDHDIFRLYPPGITVVQQPVEEIATTAVQLLINQIGNARPVPQKANVLIPARLIVRGSV